MRFTSWNSYWNLQHTLTGCEWIASFLMETSMENFGNLQQYWTWTRAKFERGTTERVLMVKPSGEVSRTGRIFSQSSLTLRSWKILWNQIYLLELLQVFNIECEEVNELVSDQCLLAYASSSTSWTLKV